MPRCSYTPRKTRGPSVRQHKPGATRQWKKRCNNSPLSFFFLTHHTAMENGHKIAHTQKRLSFQTRRAWLYTHVIFSHDGNRLFRLNYHRPLRPFTGPAVCCPGVTPKPRRRRRLRTAGWRFFRNTPPTARYEEIHTSTHARTHTHTLLVTRKHAHTHTH